jgi:hypothetical protein
MMTLSINGSWTYQRQKNAALLSPCRTQSSPRVTAFCGARELRKVSASLLPLDIRFYVLDLFYGHAMFRS